MPLLQISNKPTEVVFDRPSLATTMKGYYIYVTEACNLRCQYCFVTDKQNHNHMTDEMREVVADWIVNDPEGRDTKYVHFFGGEPLLRPKTVFWLAEYLRSHYKGTLTFGITTNGTVLTEDICKQLKKYDIGVQLSLDGSAEGNDVHRQLMGGSQTEGNVNGGAKRKAGAFSLVKVDMYLKHFGKNARMTVTSMNAKFLAKSVRELSDLGFNSFSVCVDNDSEWSADDFKVYEREAGVLFDMVAEYKAAGRTLDINIVQSTFDLLIKKGKAEHLCNAGRTVIGITVDGEIYPCHDFAGRFRTNPAEREKLLIGNVAEGYRASKNVEMFEDLRVRPDMVSGAGHDCGSCHAKHACEKGCPYINYTREGNVHVVNRNYCETTRIHALHALRHIANGDEYTIMSAVEKQRINDRMAQIAQMLSGAQNDKSIAQHGQHRNEPPRDWLPSDTAPV